MSQQSSRAFRPGPSGAAPPRRGAWGRLALSIDVLGRRRRRWPLLRPRPCGAPGAEPPTFRRPASQCQSVRVSGFRRAARSAPTSRLRGGPGGRNAPRRSSSQQSSRAFRPGRFSGRAGRAERGQSRCQIMSQQSSRAFRPGPSGAAPPRRGAWGRLALSIDVLGRRRRRWPLLRPRPCGAPGAEPPTFRRPASQCQSVRVSGFRRAARSAAYLLSGWFLVTLDRRSFGRSAPNRPSRRAPVWPMRSGNLCTGVKSL